MKKAIDNEECAYCSSTQVDLKACTGCGLVCYCSKACQATHWKAKPGHKDRCIAPKDRKPPASQPTQPTCTHESDLCGICFEPLIGESALQSSALQHQADTQTLVCSHSFHLKCASDLAASTQNSSCPLCRGSFLTMKAEALFLEADEAFDVIQALVAKRQ